MGKKSDLRSGIKISDHISESLVTIVGALNSLSIQCCGYESWIEKSRSGIRDKNPGSVTVSETL
jgi:hypothetical protein